MQAESCRVCYFCPSIFCVWHCFVLLYEKVEDEETEEWEGDDDDSSDDEKIESDDYCGTTASFSQ